MFLKISVLKSVVNFIGKNPCWSLFLIKLQAWGDEETPTQVFSWEICKIFKKTSSGCFWFTYLRKYGRALNMRLDVIIEGFSIFQDCQHVWLLHIQDYTRFWICLDMAEYYLNKLFWLWRGSEYPSVKFHGGLNMLPVLNMARQGKKQCCEYARLIRGSEYVWISLVIANTKKYLQSDWPREYNIGRICTLFSIFLLFH